MVTVISLFAGCGGSSLGYKLAGYKELLAIEWDKNAVETFKLNFTDVPIWQKDICKVTGKEILDFCKIKKRKPTACQHPFRDWAILLSQY